MNRYHLRLAFNSLVALIPRWMLAGFFKTFLTRPEIAEAAGFHVYPRMFASPFPILEEIDWQRLEVRRSMPCINFREKEALQLVDQLRRFTAELDSVPYDRSPPDAPFWFDNAAFLDFDAAALHAVLRDLKPKRYVELGCGFSSYISSHALALNAREGAPCDALYADPDPRCDLSRVLATGRVLRQTVQSLPLELFTKLEANDVLFIDTSHVLKVQSDVVRELVEIIPSLAPGVWIHIHDVFSPYDYPEDWVRHNSRLTYNEQYGLECLLIGGECCEVVLPLYLLWKEHRGPFQKLFSRGKHRPQSFWIRRSRKVLSPPQ
jgi:hypothetical protein